MNLNISISVIIFMICFEKNINNTEIITAVKKLICKEFLTIDKKDFLFFLPIAKPIIPSVEKAYASRKKQP